MRILRIPVEMTNPKGFRNIFQVEDEERKKQKTYLKQREFSQINVKHKTIDTGISVITKQNKCKKLYAVISFSNLRKSKEKNKWRGLKKKKKK